MPGPRGTAFPSAAPRDAGDGRHIAMRIAYVAHALPKRRLRRLAESRLFRRSRFPLLVAISRTSAEDHAARIPAHPPPPEGAAA